MIMLPTSPGFGEFWTERRLCTFTTLRPDGTPHVVPIGAALDPDGGRAWVITSGRSHKARNVARAGGAGAPVAICCVDGARWSTLEGLAVVLEDPASITEAETRYAARYKVPRVNPERVAIRVEVTRVLGNVR